MNIILPSREASAEKIKELKKTLKDLPGLFSDKNLGAIDVKLENNEGEQVKNGTVLLESTGGNIQIALDPVSRRFRAGGISPGDYLLKATDSINGSGNKQITVRAGNVSRNTLVLDGIKPQMPTTVRFQLKGFSGNEIRLRAKDRINGKLVFDKTVPVKDELVEIKDFLPGRFHWDFGIDDNYNCYDSDEGGLNIHLNPHRIDWQVVKSPIPNPPDPRFHGLPLELEGFTRILPELGIHSLAELASVEPEDLMHRSQKLSDKNLTPTNSKIFGIAIREAKNLLGAHTSSADQQTQFRMKDGSETRKSWIPRTAGEGETHIDLGHGQKGEVIIETPQGIEQRSFTGSTIVHWQADSEDIAAGKAFRISLKNISGKSSVAKVFTKMPKNRLVPGFVPKLLTTKEMIESICRGVAEQNPGLGYTVPDAIMEPENIQMWLDRAQTFMREAGVCSINDLGRFRMNPLQKFKTGVYAAPVVQPPAYVPPLLHYAFRELISNSILYYQPNDLLHETAVVLAGEWDIRGQSVVIAKEVRELVVIARSVLHDSASRITWEMPVLPSANSYWPNPAPAGSNGNGAGVPGQDGADGDPNPHPSYNGGADAVTPAPTITMYILDATNNLPPIDLKGQQGGTGGRGQNGGRGGNGAEGLRADGTFFGGCCRGVGTGGNGGQGGDAGRGGKGGNGGRGGLITLLTSPASIAILAAVPPTIDINGGNGGDGGPAGDPGEGGTGGPAGTADCETWCDDHPERRGSDGATGAPALQGLPGDNGPMPVEDAFQVLPITEEQWNQEFNKPHILSIQVAEAEPGETVQITGQNFDPAIDRVYFDGVNVGPVTSATAASFTVPLDADGGYHPIIVREPGLSDRRSNRVMLRVLPKLDDIAAGTRWVENQAVTLNGLAFKPGLQVLAEDRSVSPAASYSLPVTGVTRTAINLQVPGGFLGSLRGVRRIVVRNPDGGVSRGEKVARISDTIVVRCAAFIVKGTSPGIGTTRTVAEITNLFAEGPAFSITIPWSQARISFRLVQAVTTINVSDTNANIWPLLDNPTDTGILSTAPGVNGALNFFFVRDVEIATAYAYFGGGPLFIGDEGGPLSPVDFQQVVAHEVGHSLCLRHICDGGSEGPGTFFNRLCDDGDDAFLMYPYWDTSNGMAIDPGQVDPARLGATHFEDGKTASLPATSLFQGMNTAPQCLTADTQN
ncbi:IPT/TIG domain-containing protein [Flavihumibacter petaseus]|uniref:Uncharacterized protein n=1 Tax=Flavihumibacter petaseus NBRC 106054 TaxID=1220578 RepID=A0A0E9N6J7_9BACT|nr:IPT/TIG domain-containing protein [Flavihumibacter petaseus]GAO45413.1 hypothetical protein FPE01S_05_01080 [Flavihumibacter petaseus NBRC 106054]